MNQLAEFRLSNVEKSGYDYTQAISASTRGPISWSHAANLLQFMATLAICFLHSWKKAAKKIHAKQKVQNLRDGKTHMTLLGVLGVFAAGWQMGECEDSVLLKPQKCHVILGGLWYPGETHSIYVPFSEGDWIARE